MFYTLVHLRIIYFSTSKGWINIILTLNKINKKKKKTIYAICLYSRKSVFGVCWNLYFILF
jgi:hypothetical protein